MSDLRSTMSRRKLLLSGGAVVAALGVGGIGGLYELVEHQVLPGKYSLDDFLGRCAVPVPPLRYGSANHSVTGSFRSRYRHRTVSYTVAWPPGHQLGDVLPLVVCLHPHNGNHTNPLPRGQFSRTPAELVDGRRLPPTAFISVDGGNGYWNPHPDDDPLGMIVNELLPRFGAGLGLGTKPHSVGIIGYSMGGFGALLLAETIPDQIGAVALISPAIWLSYPEAHSADGDAFASESAWNRANVLAHAARLHGIPIRLATGTDDPFYPDIKTAIPSLPAGTDAVFGPGCHGGDFAAAQQGPSLEFVCSRLIR